MKKYGLLAELSCRRKWVQMGQQIHKYENLLNRDFHAERPNSKWVTDKKYLALLDANDEQERQNPPSGFNKKDVQKKLEDIQKRIGELNEQLAEIEENGGISITDPDSKMMLVKSSGKEVSHKIQIVSARKVLKTRVFRTFLFCLRIAGAVGAERPYRSGQEKNVPDKIELSSANLT